MVSEKQRVASGVNRLDLLLGGLFIGDNVLWHDDAGSLAAVFCLNFIQASELEEKPIIYVCFDSSPKSLLQKLGHLAQYPALTILDCFTSGKGKAADTFRKFYEEGELPCPVLRVQNPQEMRDFEEVLYQAHAPLKGDVRFTFESTTGMAVGDEVTFSGRCSRQYWGRASWA